MSSLDSSIVKDACSLVGDWIVVFASVSLVDFEQPAIEVITIIATALSVASLKRLGSLNICMICPVLLLLLLNAGNDGLENNAYVSSHGTS